MPLVAAAAIGVGGSLISGAMQSSAANKAAKAQERSALEAADVQREALGFQKEVYEQGREDSLPWLEMGQTALQQLGVEMGLSDGESKFQTTPGYEFAVQEGEKGVMNNLSALGMKNSGAALKALTRFREGLANQEYGTYYSRLAGLAGTGQNQVQSNNALGANTAASLTSGSNALGSTIQNAGAARASGYVGGANAWSNALGGATSNISNALGMYSQMGGNSAALGAFPSAPGALPTWF